MPAPAEIGMIASQEDEDISIDEELDGESAHLDSHSHNENQQNPTSLHSENLGSQTSIPNPTIEGSSFMLLDGHKPEFLVGRSPDPSPPTDHNTKEGEWYNDPKGFTGPFTNTVFQDSDFKDDEDAFENNWENPRTYGNLEFEEGDFYESEEFEGNWPERKTPSPDDKPQEDELADSDKDSPRNEDHFSDDSDDEFESNWGDASEHDTIDDLDEWEGDELSDSDDMFESNWHEQPSTSWRDFTNTTFSEEDLANDGDDFGSNYPSDSDMEHGQRSPPQNPSNLPPNPNTRQDIFLQSLLDAPKASYESVVTKEDLAIFAQFLSDQTNQAQKAQFAQAQQLRALQGQGVQQASNAPNAARQRSNKKVERDNKAVKLQASAFLWAWSCMMYLTNLQKRIRLAAFALMKRVASENKDPAPIGSATPDDIKRFAQNPKNPALGPQGNNLVLDFNDGCGPGSTWNKKATRIFTEIFIQTNNQYTVEEVSKGFRTHIFQLKNQYIAYRRFVDNSAMMGSQANVLTSQEANVHIARMGRRNGILHRRVKVCEQYSTHKEIKRVTDLWDTMPVEAISGDETDHRAGQARYIITTLPWRAAWVRQWMLVFDRLHLAKRFSNTGRATAGAFPHIRIAGDRPRIDRECTTVPIGLPKNFYCSEWLSKQSPRTIEDLKMKEPIDTTFSSEIIRIALTCSNVVSHRTPPVPLNDIPEYVNQDMITNGWNAAVNEEDMEIGENRDTDISM